jgi:hypothetical protein
MGVEIGSVGGEGLEGLAAAVEGEEVVMEGEGEGVVGGEGGEEGEGEGEGEEEVEAEAEEEESDPDVLALPSLTSLASALDLWLPLIPSRKAELALQRAVVSCSDLLEENASTSTSGN